MRLKKFFSNINLLYFLHFITQEEEKNRGKKTNLNNNITNIINA